MAEKKHKQALTTGSALRRKEKSMFATSGTISVRSGFMLLTLVTLFLIGAALITGNPATKTQVGGITVERSQYDQKVSRISDGFARN